jgi:hypothetical protein
MTCSGNPAAQTFYMPPLCLQHADQSWGQAAVVVPRGPKDKKCRGFSPISLSSQIETKENRQLLTRTQKLVGAIYDQKYHEKYFEEPSYYWDERLVWQWSDIVVPCNFATRLSIIRVSVCAGQDELFFWMNAKLRLKVLIGVWPAIQIWSERAQWYWNLDWTWRCQARPA